MVHFVLIMINMGEPSCSFALSPPTNMLLIEWNTRVINSEEAECNNIFVTYNLKSDLPAEILWKDRAKHIYFFLISFLLEEQAEYVSKSFCSLSRYFVSINIFQSLFFFFGKVYPDTLHHLSAWKDISTDRKY